MPYRTKSGHRLYTLPEVATMMNVHPVTVWRWVRDGKMVPWFVGCRNDHYFLAGDIHAFKERFSATVEGYMPRDPAARQAARRRKGRKREQEGRDGS